MLKKQGWCIVKESSIDGINLYFQLTFGLGSLLGGAGLLWYGVVACINKMPRQGKTLKDSYAKIAQKFVSSFLGDSYLQILGNSGRVLVKVKQLLSNFKAER